MALLNGMLRNSDLSKVNAPPQNSNLSGAQQHPANGNRCQAPRGRSKTVDMGNRKIDPESKLNEPLVNFMCQYSSPKSLAPLLLWHESKARHIETSSLTVSMSYATVCTVCSSLANPRPVKPSSCFALRRHFQVELDSDGA